MDYDTQVKLFSPPTRFWKGDPTGASNAIVFEDGHNRELICFSDNTVMSNHSAT